eukprot:CAMPEP_0182474806 /NCGR_PEP_ID=MMETSP1319-20130603/26307_1 /TAXON_ID=172717 /ORGANISM="Bolidomonas pacifica, Strain RCC208" /LENGTH=398 /DNA_ID=CAMNT_0024675737 /DNA_START=92 /DNA_END=1285 /DNA_ORIENTATION=+
MAALINYDSPAHRWFTELLGENQFGYVVAPMVDQSDLPFRFLARRHGANICYTPMIHSRMFTTDLKYREKFLPRFDESSHAQGGATIHQFCGNDPDVMLAAVKLLPAYCDVVDINCGCPQGIARRGRYGAFLLEEADLLVSIVEKLVKESGKRVTVKVRLLPSGLEDSIALYERLVDAGASLLTVHGRTRHQKGQLTGAPDWDAIAAVVKAVGDRIPVVANGGISNMDDVRRCLEVTKARGVMSSEGVLEFPALFSETNVESTGGRRTAPSRLSLAREYLDLEEQFPNHEGGQGSGLKCAKTHLQHFLYSDLQPFEPARTAMHQAHSVDDMRAVCDLIEAHRGEDHDAGAEQLGWYNRHRCEKEGETKLDVKQHELEDDFGGCIEGMWGGEVCAGEGD